MAHRRPSSTSRPPRRIPAAELQEWVRNTLEPYKYPREVEFLEEFPRTHLGKIARGKLKTG